MKDLNNILEQGFKNRSFSLSDGESEEIWGRITHSLAATEANVASAPVKAKAWWKRPVYWSFGAIAAAVVAGIVVLKPETQNVSAVPEGSKVVAQYSPFQPKAEPMKETTLAIVEDADDRNGATTYSRGIAKVEIIAERSEKRDLEVADSGVKVSDAKEALDAYYPANETVVTTKTNDTALEVAENSGAENQAGHKPAREKRRGKEYDLFDNTSSAKSHGKNRVAVGVLSNISSRGNLSRANNNYINGLVAQLGYNDFSSSSSAPVITPTSEVSYSVPLNFGLTFTYKVSDRFAVGSGVTYTYLHNRYDGIIDNSTYRIKQGLHFVGIPLNIYYSIMDNSKWSLYINGGGTVEKGVRAHYTMSTLSGAKESANSHVSGVQYSVNAGMGVEYRIGDGNFGIYAEPNAAYYFDSHIPNSIRTSEPFQFQLQVGVRLHIK